MFFELLSNPHLVMPELVIQCFTIKKRICNAVFAAIMRKRSGTNTQTIKIEDQCKN